MPKKPLNYIRPWTLIAVLCALLLTFSSAGAWVNLKIDGSTTLYPILEIAQTQFAAFFPDAILEITPTGSQHGQVSLLNGYVDMAMSCSACDPANAKVPTSGAFTTDPYTLTAADSPYDCGEVHDTVIALDAIGILVNNSMASCIAASGRNYITREEIAAIWGDAAVETWEGIWPGCPAQPITPRARNLDSGTRQTFIDLAAVFPSAERTVISATGLDRLADPNAVRAAIAAEATHIGYASLPYPGSGTVFIPVDWDPEDEVGPVTPSKATVLDASYPLSRALHLFTIRPDADPLPYAKQHAIELYTWAAGLQGQTVVDVTGYAPAGPLAPRWDVNADGVASVLDLTAIGARWGQSNPVRYWIRADASANGSIGVTDLTTVGAHWGESW